MLKDKALANLRLGETLLVAGRTDAAANRLYYAMYQASVARPTFVGWTPGRLQSGAVRWSHEIVRNNASLVRRRQGDGSLYETMRRLRTVADYWESSVALGALTAHLDAVSQFVQEATR